MINRRNRTGKYKANMQALNSKVESFVTVHSINTMIVQRTNVFVTRATAWAFCKVYLTKITKILETLATVCEDEEECLCISALNNLIGNKKIDFILLFNGEQKIVTT